MTHLVFIPEIFGISLEVYVILIVLGVPIFFFWRWVFKKFIKSDRKRKITTWVVTIVSAPLIYVGFILILFSIIEYYPNHDFDREIWIKDKDVRYELSKDIIDSKMLIGKSKTDIKKLLGGESNTDDSDVWYYDIGVKPVFLAIDESVIEIVFKNDKVINVEQHDH